MAKITIFLLVAICVLYSNAGITFDLSNKAAEYRDFLKKSIEGTPTAPVTPELENLQNIEERSGKFEGDIILTNEQIDAIVAESQGQKNAILNTQRLWPNKILYYDIAPGFTSAQISAITKGVEDLSRLSCLKTARRTTQNNYVLVKGGNGGCFSSVGYVGGAQVLNLAPSSPGSGCFRHGTIVHEFLHAVGFYHMQSTHDRDDWVRIVWDKIQQGTEHNFNKYSSSQVSNLGTTYDYGSVLHYSEYGFSIDGSKTIVPLKATSETIGQRVGMSQRDITKLKKLYSCPGY